MVTRLPDGGARGALRELRGRVIRRHELRDGDDVAIGIRETRDALAPCTFRESAQRLSARSLDRLDCRVHVLDPQIEIRRRHTLVSDLDRLGADLRGVAVARVEADCSTLREEIL